MTSAGWIDCLLYSLTRRAFLARPPTTEAPSRFNYDAELVQTGRYSEILTPTNGSGNTITNDTTTHDTIRREDKIKVNGVKVERTWEVRTTCEGSETGVDRLQHQTSVMARGSRKSLTLAAFGNAF